MKWRLKASSTSRKKFCFCRFWSTAANDRMDSC